MELLDLNPGKQFAGRYTIQKLLGEGGMGKVYLATDSLLNNEELALKLLHGDLTRDERHTKRFLREVQLTRKVTHTNIVRTFDVGRNIGIDRVTGGQTSVMTIVTESDGTLVTAFPGVPSRYYPAGSRRHGTHHP